MAKAPRYLGDLYTYVWQPYVKIPETELADLFLSQAAAKPRNVLILLKSATNAAVLLSEYHKQLLEPLDSMEAKVADSPTEILESVFRLFQQLITDSKSFLLGAYEQISILVSNLEVSDLLCSKN